MQRYIFWGVIILSTVFISLLGIGYMTGYRLGPGITLVRVHELHITNLPVGANVFTDYASRGFSATTTMNIVLVPGAHDVIVSKKGFWPWRTIATIPEDKDATVRALLIPKIVTGTLLQGTEAKVAGALAKETTRPSVQNPLVLENGCALVSVSDTNKIIATPVTTSTCTPPRFLCVGNTCAPTVIFSPVSKPTSVVSYPGRKDALLVGIGKIVYALSIDPRNPRTFAPILHGIAPRLVVMPSGMVVVVDQSAVYQLAL